MTDALLGYHPLDQFSLHDLESIRLLLRGGSIIDWHRINLTSRHEAERLVTMQGLDVESDEDRQYIDVVRNEAIDYLKRNFDFPVPRPIKQAALADLMMMAAGRGHRQVCACSILKVMHVVHHLKSKELRGSLPLSDLEVFKLVENKVYRVLNPSIRAGLPIKTLTGGWKHRDGEYTKLLAKKDNIAARIYDKIRFRVVTEQRDQIIPVLAFLTNRLFAYNYVIPQQSTNTLLPFRSFVESNPHMKTMSERLQLPLGLEEDSIRCENEFSDPSFRVVHFVVDLPIRIGEYLEQAGIHSTKRGPIIFSLTEFQIIDEETHTLNEKGPSSHAAYKERQRQAVQLRLKLGLAQDTRRQGGTSEPACEDTSS